MSMEKTPGLKATLIAPEVFSNRLLISNSEAAVGGSRPVCDHLRSGSEQPIHYGLYCTYLPPVLPVVLPTAVAPKIPAPVWVVGRSRRLWIKHNDIVGGSPAVISGIPHQVVVDGIHVLPTAVEGDM